MNTILITGSTDGIGKLAATQLAADGHQLILHGRNKTKLDQVIDDIKTVSNKEAVSGYVSDFSNLSSVEEMSKQIMADYSVIDVLINNAGVFKSPDEKSEEGLDVRLVVNYLAPVLLTESLQPLLDKSEAPRVINLSSAAQSPVSLNALSGQEIISMQAAYAQSKLALTMWSFDLAKKWPFAIVIAVNPGSLLNTKMANEVYGQHWSPATKGSNILYDLAVSDDYKNNSGQYFDNDKGDLKGTFANVHSDAYNSKKIAELIAQTSKILKRIKG